jgi:DNA-binding CsgD family transcriptional regulator
MILQALGYVGNLYRETDNKKAISCLIEAKDIAHELKDTTGYYLQLSDLSMAYYLDSLYVEAKDAAVECINNYKPNNNMLFNAANAYAALNMPDSARFFLDKVGSTNLSDYDRMMVMFAKGYISKAEGDEIQALRFERLANAISDSIKANSKRNEILETEELMNSVFNNGNKANKIKVSTMKYVVIVGLIIFLLIVSVLSYIVIKKHLRHKRLHSVIQQNQALIESLIEDNKKNISKLKSTKEHNESLKQQYISQIRITDYLNNYFNSFNYLLQKSKKLSHEKFVEEFKQTVAVASQDERFWYIISILANKKSNNLVAELQKRHPSLTDTDIKILNLICLGYKNDAIAACTGLEKSSVKSTKTTIKNKIGAPINLEAFITITSHNSSNL